MAEQVKKTATTPKTTAAKAPATKPATAKTATPKTPATKTATTTQKSPVKTVAKKSDKQIKVTLIKSTNKCVIGMKKTVQALGLHRIGETKIHNDNPAIRGAIFKVKHLVKVEEVNAKEAK